MTSKPTPLSEKIEDLICEDGKHPTLFCNYIHVTDVQSALKNAVEEWREKCKRMEIMTGSVAILELDLILKTHFGSLMEEGK